MGFVIRATGGRVILIHVAKQNGYESCLLFSPEERNVKNVNKENARGMQDDTISKRQAIDALEKWLHGLFGITEADGTATIFKTIRQLPPIQPKRGTWIDRGERGDWEWQADGRGEHWHEWECNICHHYFDKRTFFCPHCGADMRGEQYG